ncbi:serine hydrolase [Pelosinus baikalensis]|uniref:Class A beta-lactamase-related serine hydrolase n=1 Tax=Pelosinus baikalensis TaxID=2892015 RepID=A0ABS8HR17_9FIRM|nr:serine hydrolase [Pelosinus baikalensis]MCC5465505.1 class A beta-lactamase-related serine hydrolase [Pelosinus baikalensis]
MNKAILMLFSMVLLFSLSACGTLNAPQEKPEVGTPPPIASQPLPEQESLQLINELKQFNGQIGLYARNLKTNQTLQFNQNIIFPTASTHKLVVAIAIYKYLYPNASVSEKQHYDENIKQMMIVSDNPAFYELLDIIEAKQPDALTRVLTDLNLVNTRIHSREAFKEYGYHSVTTPYEMSLVFETIYNETYLGKEFSSILKEELSNTIFQEEIPRFLQGKKVLHKVGELPGVQCDVGIIDDGQNVVLISLYTTTKQPLPYASNFLADISAKIYNALKSSNP